MDPSFDQGQQTAPQAWLDSVNIFLASCAVAIPDAVNWAKTLSSWAVTFRDLFYVTDAKEGTEVCRVSRDYIII